MGLFSFKGSIAEPPKIFTPDKIFNMGWEALCSTLKNNLIGPIGGFKDIWARPAPKFPAAYLWDSSFIARAWRIWDPVIGARVLRHFVDFQDRDGRMPHMVFLGKKVSPLSNPPFLAWSLNDLFDVNPSYDRITFYLEPLLKFIDWRKEFRYHKDPGLFFWIHSYESGIDNSPRFSSADEKVFYNVRNLAAVDLNSEIILQHVSLIDILRKFRIIRSSAKNGDSSAGIGFDSDFYIHRLESEVLEIIKAVEAHLWSEKNGFYADLDVSSGELRAIDTIASYFPIPAYAKVFNSHISHKLDANLRKKIEERLKKSIERILDPTKYNTPVPFPSVARDDPLFLKDMWRGPVWINTAYLVLEGLFDLIEGPLSIINDPQKAYFSYTLGDMAYRLAKGVFYTWNNMGSFYEFYDPERYDHEELSRKKGNLYKRITLGAKPVKKFAGWTADIIPIIIDYIFGVKIYHGIYSGNKIDGNRDEKSDGWDILLRPHIPADWMESAPDQKDFNPISVYLPYYDIRLQYEITPNSNLLNYNLKYRSKSMSGTVENTVGESRIAL